MAYMWVLWVGVFFDLYVSLNNESMTLNIFTRPTLKKAESVKRPETNCKMFQSRGEDKTKKRYLEWGKQKKKNTCEKCL